MFFRCEFGHVLRHRTYQAVAQQNAEECAHQRRRHLMPNLFRRSAQRAHRNHHTQHRRHDSQTGQGIRHRRQRRHRLLFAVMLHLHVEVHHLVHVEGVHAAGDHHPHGVAHELAQMMVLHKFRVGLEDGALFRLLDVAFDGQHPSAARLLQQLVHHPQRGQIPGLAEFRGAENGHGARHDLLQNAHRIRDQQRAHARAADNQQLGRLQQHRQMPVLHQIAGCHRSKHHQNADDCKHAARGTSRACAPCARGPPRRPFPYGILFPSSADFSRSAAVRCCGNLFSCFASAIPQKTSRAMPPQCPVSDTAVAFSDTRAAPRPTAPFRNNNFPFRVSGTTRAFLFLISQAEPDPITPRSFACKT